MSEFNGLEITQPQAIKAVIGRNILYWGANKCCYDYRCFFVEVTCSSSVAIWSFPQFSTTWLLVFIFLWAAIFLSISTIDICDNNKFQNTIYLYKFILINLLQNINVCYIVLSDISSSLNTIRYIFIYLKYRIYFKIQQKIVLKW